MTGKVRTRLRVLFLVLASLAIAQLAWWSYLLIDQQIEISQLIGSDIADQKKNRFIFMILSEGAFWLIMWTMGLFSIYRTIKQERNLYKAHRDFLSGITHELKTPIANIQLCLQALQRGNIDTEKQSVFIQRALLATTKLHNEIQNILKLNQQTQSTNRTKDFIDISELVETLLSHLESEDSEHIVFNPSTKLEPLKSEKEGLEIILRTLIENAIKYTNIRTKFESDFEARVEISIDNENLYINDNGIGISKDEIDNVFGEFYRSEYAKNLAIPGTGVGLSIANQIAGRLNMKIHIHSDGINKGSQVVLNYRK